MKINNSFWLEYVIESSIWQGNKKCDPQYIDWLNMEVRWDVW